VGYETLDTSGDMELRRYKCIGTGYDCPLVAVELWEEK